MLRSNSIDGTDVASADPIALLESVNESNILPLPSPERGAPLFKPDSYVIDGTGDVISPRCLHLFKVSLTERKCQGGAFVPLLWVDILVFPAPTPLPKMRRGSDVICLGIEHHSGV